MFVDWNKDDLMLKYLYTKERAESLAKTIRWTTEAEGIQFQRVLVSKHFCLAVLLINQSHMSRRFSWLINVYVNLCTTSISPTSIITPGRPPSLYLPAHR